MILQQPWARLVAEGVFPVLIRSTATNVRGPVAIVARGIDENAMVDDRAPDPDMFPQPALIGYVRISNCVKVPRDRLVATLRRLTNQDFVKFYPKHYIPDGDPVFLWFLESPRLLHRPKRLRALRSRVWVRLPGIK